MWGICMNVLYNCDLGLVLVMEWILRLKEALKASDLGAFFLLSPTGLGCTRWCV